MQKKRHPFRQHEVTITKRYTCRWRISERVDATDRVHCRDLVEEIAAVLGQADSISGAPSQEVNRMAVHDTCLKLDTSKWLKQFVDHRPLS